jgi:signal transduction histidine kinase
MLDGPLTAQRLAAALLPVLRADLALRWIALAVDGPLGQEITASEGEGPMAVGDLLSGRPAPVPGYLIVPCRFGTRQVATLVAEPRTSNDPQTRDILEGLSDCVAVALQAGPAADVEPAPAWESRLRENKLSVLALLAAGLAHEVRNPLLVARSYLDLIGEELDALAATPAAEPSQSLRQFHAESLQGIRQAMAVLSDYRSLAVESGQWEPIDLVALCQEMVRMARPAFAPGPGIEVTAAAAPLILAKRSQVTQILLNLLINASQAAGPSGQVLITVAGDRDGDEVRLTVGNDGRSITAEAKRHLFEPLVTTKDIAGTGLGLAISQALAQRMGGRIEVGSRPDWTTFTLTLPLHRA